MISIFYLTNDFKISDNLAFQTCRYSEKMVQSFFMFQDIHILHELGKTYSDGFAIKLGNQQIILRSGINFGPVAGGNHKGIAHVLVMDFIDEIFNVLVKKSKFSPCFGISFLETDAENSEIGGFVNVGILVHKATANLRL